MQRQHYWRRLITRYQFLFHFLLFFAFTQKRWYKNHRRENNKRNEKRNKKNKKKRKRTNDEQKFRRAKKTKIIIVNVFCKICEKSFVIVKTMRKKCKNVLSKSTSINDFFHDRKIVKQLFIVCFRCKTSSIVWYRYCKMRKTFKKSW